MKKLIALAAILSLSACGGKKFVKSPVDIMIRDMMDKEAFSIILYDMNVEGNFSKDYYHQYRVIVTKKDSSTDERITEWKEVSRDFFERNINNMGMELAAKSPDGKINKTPAPPGYSSYVGNSRYGHWNNRNGNSFWAFYGQYAFMSSMFNMMNTPVRRSYYNDYSRNYSGRKPYYGPSSGGRKMYGTGSTYTSRNRSNSSWSRNPNARSFRQRVNNSVRRSSSRYSRSSRSRSGGFGK